MGLHPMTRRTVVVSAALVALTAAWNVRGASQSASGPGGGWPHSRASLVFRTGRCHEIDRVEVDWPSGRKQVVTTGIQDRSTLRLTEPR
jgi:hypothetical protein